MNLKSISISKQLLNSGRLFDKNEINGEALVQSLEPLLLGAGVIRKRFCSGYLINLIMFLLMFLGTTVLRLYPDWFDRPVAKVLNNFAMGHCFANELAHGTAYPTLQGMIVVSLLWYCWFSDDGPELRARLVIGAGAAVIAGLIAHLLRYTMPPTFRPIFDPLLQLHPPNVLGDIEALRANFNFPAFPSERATMFAGLSLTIFLVRSDVGLLAFGCVTAVEFSRIYLGLHYSTDILGSFSLAASVVWFAQIGGGSVLGRPFVGWERTSPSTFYMCAFLASYQMTTAFEDLRELARSFSAW
jgi:undecaprenyl-diphosphatase